MTIEINLQQLIAEKLSQHNITVSKNMVEGIIKESAAQLVAQDPQHLTHIVELSKAESIAENKHLKEQNRKLQLSVNALSDQARQTDKRILSMTDKLSNLDEPTQKTQPKQNDAVRNELEELLASGQALAHLFNTAQPEPVKPTQKQACKPNEDVDILAFLNELGSIAKKQKEDLRTPEQKRIEDELKKIQRAVTSPQSFSTILSLLNKKPLKVNDFLGKTKSSQSNAEYLQFIEKELKEHFGQDISFIQPVSSEHLEELLKRMPQSIAVKIKQ